MRPETWKRRYAARMAASLGEWEGCYESAEAAWQDSGEDHTPEESADNEVAEWRRLMGEEGQAA